MRETAPIAIMGTPVSSGNRGVMALGASLINLCAGEAGGKDVFLMLGHQRREQVPFRVDGKIRYIEVVNYRLSPRAKLREHLGWILMASIFYRIFPLKALRNSLSRYTPWIAALERADLVGDVRGGDSFSDIYGMRRFLVGFLEVFTVLMVKGSIVQFPQTFGPYKSALSRWLARFILKRSSVIIARDATSQKVAQELVGKRREVLLSPDVAFSLETVAPSKVEVFPALKGSRPSCLIGLNVNGLMFNGGYTRKNMFGLKLDYRSLLLVLIQTLLEEHRDELWLVPHTYGPSESVESDPEACRQVREALPEDLKTRVRIVTGDYDCHELKGIIGMFDFFIGSRMHACIAALSQGIPCVGIAYSRKFEGVFRSVGMVEWVVDGRDTGTQEALRRVVGLYRKRDTVRRLLKRNADKARDELGEVFSKVLASARSRVPKGVERGLW
ncbi:MAG: polysaccharide pyruvyl transferase family protein [Deltaproteobacteria bacterium]|nr:polysaccharide pyruvyl transferase family protein [Deltaproteobacteria bacterium]